MAHAKKTKIKKIGDRKQNGKKDVVIEDELDEITVELTDQQMLFCQQYVANNLNGTKAAIKAGYTEANAGVHASRLLSNDNIKKYVEVLKKDLGKRIGITADMIALELAKIGFADVRKFYTENNSLQNINELNDEAAGAISSVEVFEEFEGQGENRQLIGFTRKVKMHDKVRSLESLAKMIGADGVLKIAQTDTAGNDVVLLPKKDLHEKS
ncbi:MAG: terminase small subunit [Flavobacteriales bacterium]|nr:terminase small subunit [Flavobacteriales bacterium]